VPIRCSSDFRAIPMATSHFAMRSRRPGAFGRLTSIAPEMTPSAQRIDCSRNEAEGKDASAMPSSMTSAAFSVRLFLSGFSMTTLRAFSMPMRFGSSHAPPQPGMIPRKTSGSATAGTDSSTVR
jgi:hypothetical protein